MADSDIDKIETTRRLLNGDCLEYMKKLPDKSIDLFICDLPYGETNCKWDCKIDMVEFWKEFKRIRKSTRTACIHFCSTKFGYTLIKSWEKGFKMDMVWKKRNKTGGLQSRNRPMRNHEMVYFFYEQAPKYNRDKYHKRIQAKKDHNIEKEDITVGKTSKHRKSEICFDPKNPASVVEEKCYEYNGKKYVRDKNYTTGYKELNGSNFGTYGFEPPNPASVVEEKSGGDIYGEKKMDQITRRKEMYKKSGNVNNFEPPNPASVVEEKYNSSGYKKELVEGVKNFGTYGFEPPNPASVVEEDEPVSMFESTKVFIGKRHHQTEKPQDILEFFLKYWTDEGDTVLDPTMGSGSTGVACETLNRNFIGYEMDPTIFKVAQKRMNQLTTP